MKKWLLLSTVIHLLVLMITFPQNENIPLAKNSEKISFVKVNLKFNKKVGTKTSSHDFSKHKTKIVKIKEKSDNSSKINQISDEKIETKVSVDEKIIENSKELSLENFGNKTQSSETEGLEKEKKEEIFSENHSIEGSTSEILSEKIEYGIDIDSKNIDKNLISQGFVIENEELIYKILETPNPSYPFKAQILNLTETVKIIAEFTVNLEGKVKDIDLSSDFSDFRVYNFDKSIEKALKKYRFTPISYKGEKVQVRFRKVFEFNK